MTPFGFDIIRNCVTCEHGRVRFYIRTFMIAVRHGVNRYVQAEELDFIVFIPTKLGYYF